MDQIEFTDMAGNRAMMQVLEELLPARFTRIRPAGDTGGGKAVEFENLVLLPGAAQSKASDGTTLLTRAVGKGKVVVAAGPVLEPAAAGIQPPAAACLRVHLRVGGRDYTGWAGTSILRHRVRHAGAGGPRGRDDRAARFCRLERGVEGNCRQRPIHFAGECRHHHAFAPWPDYQWRRGSLDCCPAG